MLSKLLVKNGIKKLSIIAASQAIDHSLIQTPKKDLTKTQHLTIANLIGEKVREMAIEENTKNLHIKKREIVKILVKNPARRTKAELESIIPVI